MGTERNGNGDGGGEVRVKGVVPDHFVRPTNATSIPQNLIFVDCESNSRPDAAGYGDRQSLRLGVAVGVRREGGKWARRDVLQFTDTFDFWEWAIARVDSRRPVWIFSHNLGCDATWLDVWARVDDQTLRLNIPCPNCGGYEKSECGNHRPFRGAAVVSDPPVILCFKCATGIIRMIDTMNYWKTSVYKLGMGIGLPKLEKPPAEAPDSEWFAYCKRDTEIIEKSICQLLDEWERDECGHFATTAAGLAWAAFRRTIQPKQILIDHGEPHTEMERAAYFGGQAEAYYVGPVRETVYLLDVRSLYPHVMHSSFFPTQFLRMGKRLDIAAVKDRLMFDCAVARVVVRTERAGYPKIIRGQAGRREPLPAAPGNPRARWRSDRLGFPVGNYGTTLAGPELLRGIERGEIEEILEVAWYRSAKLFGPFVDEWFARRPAEVTPETYARDLLCKTVLNSMSGYFAKHKMRWKDRPNLRPLHWWGEWHGIHADTGKVTRYRGIGGAVQELEEGGESRDSFPAIAAYITSYGREQMLWLRDQCPDRSVYYQDTDSLMVNFAGLNALEAKGLVGNGELGRLRYLGELVDLTIHAVKDYEHAAGRTIAGVRHNATREGPGSFRQEAWESIADQWSRTPDGTVRVYSEVINLSRQRMARHVGKDGWTLPPRMEGNDSVPF